MLSASLSVTADDTSSHFCAEGLNVVVLQLHFRQLSEVQDGFIVATDLEDVVDHPGNLSARK